MTICPWILGKGRAGMASAKALALLAVQHPEFGIAPTRWLARDEPLPQKWRDDEQPLLVIAGPHGLHAAVITAADGAGIGHIVTEKPACVRLSEIKALAKVRAHVAVLHVYRMMWGPQQLQALLAAGEFGELISIEGRYWQSSAAYRALTPEPAPEGWKNNPALSGGFDTYLDVAVHWVDMVSFLAGSTPAQITPWFSYKNAAAPHRDTHVQLVLDFASGVRGFGSVSKTVHGATNHFEVNVVGTRGSATWTFLRPDELIIGRGKEQRVVCRTTTELGTEQMPFHGTGWLEGYVQIMRGMVEQMRGSPQRVAPAYPDLTGSLALLRQMLTPVGPGVS